MRTLKYVILGLINRSPITGYDITKEFNDRTMSNFWYAKHSQVYPELKKLLEEKLVEFKIEILGEKMEKKLYTITEKGRTEFHAWLLSDAPVEITPKNVFHVRTYFSNELPIKDYVKLLYSQISKRREKLRYLSDIMSRNYSEVPKVGTPELGDYMLLEGAIIREKTKIVWLYKCLSYHGEEVDQKDLSLEI